MENFEDKVFNYEDLNTTTTSTTRKPVNFNYNRPVGWNKKQPSKLSRFFSIIYKGITRQEMEPSELRRYDIWMLDIKAATIAGLIGIAFWIFAVTSGIGSEKYNENVEKTYMDRVIDYFTGGDDIQVTKEESQPAPKQVVIVKDSLVNIDSLIRVSDSLLRESEKLLPQQ